MNGAHDVSEGVEAALVRALRSSELDAPCGALETTEATEATALLVACDARLKSDVFGAVVAELSRRFDAGSSCSFVALWGMLPGADGLYGEAVEDAICQQIQRHPDMIVEAWPRLPPGADERSLATSTCSSAVVKAALTSRCGDDATTCARIGRFAAAQATDE